VWLWLIRIIRIARQVIDNIGKYKNETNRLKTLRGADAAVEGSGCLLAYAMSGVEILWRLKRESSCVLHNLRMCRCFGARFQERNARFS
jgi:hypothetical protein